MYFTAIRGTSAGKELQLTQVLCRGRARAVPMSLSSRQKCEEERNSFSKETNQNS